MATTALLSTKASLQGAQISTRLHNRHITCIHDIPPEILAEIFLSVEYYESPQNTHSQTRRNGSCSTVLASVCKTWRAFALRLPWLWSRILIKTTGVHVSRRRSKYVRLLNERSLGVTVDLAIWVQWDKGRGLSLTNTHEAGLRQLVSTLAPLAPRTRRFELVSHVYSGPDLRPILASFIKLCTSSSLEVFTVHAVHRALENAQLFDWRHLQLTDPPTDYQINSFIQPVRVLDLQDVRISWDSSFYCGLTELSVHFSSADRHVTQDQLVQILLVCPTLEALSFKNVYARDSSEPPNIYETIYLKQLKRLEFIGMRSVSLTPLLQVISANSQSLTVRLSLGKKSESVQQLRTFFERHSAITVLHVQSRVDTAWFAPLSSSLHRLSKLTLEGVDFADTDLATFIRTNHFNNGSVPWPWLYELHLIGCIVDLELLECLATSPFLKKLRLSRSGVREPGSGRCVPATLSMFEPVYGSPHVKIAVHDE